MLSKYCILLKELITEGKGGGMTKGGVADKGGMEVRANADITDKKSLKWPNM